MNKESYLDAVRDRLSGLPQGDIDRWLDYYSEMIDDRLEDGMSEDEAITAIGSADDVASQILMETPLPKLIKAKAHPSRTLRAWEIVLLVLGSPVWLSLLIAALAIFISVYITVWAVIVTLYAADLTIAVGGIAGILCCIVLAISGKAAAAFLFFGAGLVLLGLSVLLFFLFNLMTRGAIKSTALLLRWIKGLFIRN